MTHRPPRQPQLIVVVGCGVNKRAERSTAASLYTGSYFQTCYQTAIALSPGRVFILSALYGLIRPWVQVDPYNLRMGAPGSIEAGALIEQARADPGIQGKRVIALCGAVYADRLAEVWPGVERPLAGLGIGQQRGLMKRMREWAALPVRDRVDEVACPQCGALPYAKCRDELGQLAPGVLCHAARARTWRDRTGALAALQGRAARATG